MYVKFSCNIHTNGRSVQDQYTGLCLQPFTKDNLLLVSPGKRLDPVTQLVQLDSKVLHPGKTVLMPLLIIHHFLCSP